MKTRKHKLRFNGLNNRSLAWALFAVTVVLLIYIKSEDYNIKVSNEFSHIINNVHMHQAYVDNFEGMNATQIRRWIQIQNAQESILNLELHGPITSNTLIFIVQVQRYSYNLKYMLESLYRLKGIQDVLIIFSHSYLDNNLNRLIQNLSFCRILQIFYPYSVQTYPDQFPGFDKNDCPMNLSHKTAETLNCTGAKHPDIHGRYRNPIDAEKKHRWWWTANKVFEDLSCTVGYKGIVVFFENTFFLTQDFIYIIKRMRKIADSLPQCDFLSLGPTSDGYENNLYQMEMTTWDPKYHSEVLAMNVGTWNSIVSHYDLFCLIDDYTWARSLLYVSLNRRDGKRFKVLSSLAPRALQITSRPCIGEVMNCGVMENIFQTINLKTKYEEAMFPSYIEVYSNIELDDDEFMIFDHIENKGGWNDLRDKQLCSNITLNKAKQLLINMEKQVFNYNVLI